MERDFKGIWIPKEIWLSKDLNIMEKIMLVEIDSLDNENGCFASNEHFSNFFSLSKNRCSEIIKSLEKKGYIEISYIYRNNQKAIEKRIIKCIRDSDRPIRDSDRPIRDSDRGYSENREDNNTLFNNTFNNTDNKRNNVEKDSTIHLNCKEIVDYLNLKTGSQFRYTTKKTQTLIKTKLEDKYTVEDFKKVIDIKTYQWINDSKMKSYLRPETLFGSKFESYLNEWRSATNEINYRVDSKGVKRDRLGIEIL